MGCILALGAWGWAFLLTLAAFGNSREGFLVFMITISAGWAPVGFMFLLGRRKKAKAMKVKSEASSQSGIPVDSRFFHWEGDTGLALNESRQTITVAVGPNVKTYKFNEIRDWSVRSETAGQVVPIGGGVAGGIAAGAASIGAGIRADANTGLFLSVKDIENPTWRISMMDKKTREVWFEILTQAINEGGTQSGTAVSKD